MKRKMMQRVFECMTCYCFCLCLRCWPFIRWRLKTQPQTKAHIASVLRTALRRCYFSSTLKKPKQKVNKMKYFRLGTSPSLHSKRWRSILNLLRVNSCRKYDKNRYSSVAAAAEIKYSNLRPIDQPLQRASVFEPTHSTCDFPPFFICCHRQPTHCLLYEFRSCLCTRIPSL